MEIGDAYEQIEYLNKNGTIQQLIAQGKSRYILYNVDEPEENFPLYTPNLTEKNNHTAYAYLTSACYIAESEGLSTTSIEALKKGASILEFNFKSSQELSEYSDYFLLTIALAYYAAFEYSKAFVAISKLTFETKSARLLAKLLTKKFDDLDIEISNIQLNERYSTEEILKNKNHDTSKIDTEIYEFLLSKSLANVLQYFQYGNEERIEEAYEIASDILELLSEDEEPSMWWCTRLYRLILEGFTDSAIWKILPPNFPDHPDITTAFIKNLAKRKPVPIVEFFISQREAIAKVVSESGLVVSLPTSSGKTRIAEISILDALVKDDSIVLYIAPFRSLAYEVENTLETTFETIGYEVSHLYGGASFSKVDRLEIETARIIIATPEKAKALFRVAEDLVDRIKLVVVDEGHLLGIEDRFVRNEMFLEELRFHMLKNEGKFVVLSAVLPNPEHISEWLTSNKQNVHKNLWRPSSRRLGTLEYRNNNVNINWRNENPETWNNSFIQPFQSNDKMFPSNLTEAIASTAVKLTKNGSVLIFLAKSTLVKSHGRACFSVFKENKETHTWSNIKAWDLFARSIKHTLGFEDDVYKLAKMGIICHYAKLPSNVKLAIETLMRVSNPKIIISTTTLAQGVNLGVSTVIIGNIWFEIPYFGKRLSQSKFWNIVGRAGRAFVDSEGKVLYAIDKTQKKRNIKGQERLAAEYLDSENHDDVYSGVLILLAHLSDIAENASIDLGYLLELIAENSTELEKKGFNEESIEEIQEGFDFLDDTLISLSYKNKSYDHEDVSDWIDGFFRKSLFFIQATEIDEIDEESLLSYLERRNSIITKELGEQENWISHIRTGIPIRASIALKDLLPNFVQEYSNYIASDQSISKLSRILRNLEVCISTLPGKDFLLKSSFSGRTISEERANAVHKMWLKGESFKSIATATTSTIAIYFSSQYFGYTFPWVLNAVSRKFRGLEEEDLAEFYENLATQIELGLPNMNAIKNYLGGIKSRPIATEISNVITFDSSDLTLSEHIDYVLEMKSQHEDQLSSDALEWLEALILQKAQKHNDFVTFPSFTLDRMDKSQLYFVKIYNGRTFLCNMDYSSKIKVKSTDLFPFAKIAHKLGIFFAFDTNTNTWKLKQ